jgi:putative colanic acid biosynthesis UDP-glucose lipid carrier transferase
MDDWNLRYAMKPGVTGLAQISGSRGALLTLDDAHERLCYDLIYMRDWSLLQDLTVRSSCAPSGSAFTTGMRADFRS